MFRLICLVLGYIIGCIQTAYIVGRVSGIDIRDHGSGNAGSTNVLRVLGKKAAAMVFVADVSKAIIAYVIASIIFDGQGTFVGSGYGYMSIIPGLYAALGAVLGHSFPFYLKFKGGKGVACILGAILSINLLMALTIYAVGTIVLIYKRYISAASLSMCLVLPFFLYIYNFSGEAIIISAALAAVCFYLHRGNIQRILDGTERVVSFDKKEKGD